MTPEQSTHPALAKLATDYEIVREIGRGGIAVVYLARDLETGRECAIKLIRAKHLGDEEALSRVAREASYAASLRHPNILPVIAARDLGDEGVALVMEFVPGRTLKRRIREDGPLPFSEAARVLRDIASALAHAHSRGIIHRDVKPENIFLEDATPEPDVPDAERSGGATAGAGGWQRARLADFGIARSLQTDTQLTQTGFAIGTPSYMSPECIEGAPIDGRADLYSLGLVAWEMISGETPWAGESLYAVLYHQKHDQPVPAFAELRPRAPRAVALAVEGLLEKDPDLRWAAAEDFLAALDGAPPRRRRTIPDPPVDAATVRFRRPATPDAVEPEADPPLASATPVSRARRVLPRALVGVSIVLVAGYGLRTLLQPRAPVRSASLGTLGTPDRSPVVEAPHPAGHPQALVGSWSHFSLKAPLSDSLTMLLRADGSAASRERRLGLGFSGWWNRVTTREGTWEVRSTALGGTRLCLSWRGKRGARVDETCNSFLLPADSLAPLAFAGRYWTRAPRAPQ
ncbi:MAG: serine/threonine protein kinase [Gemmatimonadota bacterium]|nr:serine/threonine protein kinase [Gemmatimonadota bacterium]